MPIHAPAVNRGQKKYEDLINQYCTAFADACDTIPSPENPEIIHKIRVCARRLRILLKLFDSLFPPAAARRWRMEIRDYTRMLGNAREYDCLIAFLNTLRTKREFLQQEKIIRKLYHYFKKANARIYFRIKKDAAVFKTKMIPQRIRDSFQTRREQKHALTNIDIQKNVRRSSKRILHALAGFKRSSKNSALHFLRIEIKKLRYVLEIAERIQPTAHYNAITLCAKDQDILGKIRDMHVWNKHIEDAFKRINEQVQPKKKNALSYHDLADGQKTLSRFLKVKHGQLCGKAMTRLKALKNLTKSLTENE